MTDENSLNSLIKLRMMLEKMLGECQEQTLSIKVQNFGLTERQKKAWLQSEPDFTKRIVTPLNGRKHQTGRYQNLLAGSGTLPFGKFNFQGGTSRLLLDFSYAYLRNWLAQLIIWRTNRPLKFL